MLVEHIKSLDVKEHDEVVNEFTFILREVVVYKLLEELFAGERGESTSEDEWFKAVQKEAVVLLLPEFSLDEILINLGDELVAASDFKHVFDNTLVGL